MMQWHPIFVRLLRPMVEAHFEVQTNVPVGDMPRAADTVLLRRRSAGSLPYQGIWSNLTTWNVLEYKGRTVSPRVRDLDELVELGLGIDRRLNEQREQHAQRLLAPEQVSFWYLVNHLGVRFLRRARARLGGLDELGPGIWRWRILQRMVFLVSSDDLEIEEDSVPLHLLSNEPPEAERALARFVATQPGLLELYGNWFAYLHQEGWKEIENMAKTARKTFRPKTQPLVELVKLLDRDSKATFMKSVLKEAELKELVAWLSPSERKELKRLLQS